MVLVSESEEKKMGEAAYQETLKKSPPLSSSDARTLRVRAIGRRLEAVAGRPDFGWEFEVIDEPKTVNAFCLPGGKVVVYTGLLPVAETDDQLATVMGHEIGHAIARHGAERMSQGLLTRIGGDILAITVGAKNPAAARAYGQAYNTGAAVGLMLPFSRKHESEADYIGLILMAKAGYDPKAAASFWENMSKQASGKHKDDALSRFMSTHPSHEKRIKNIQAWLPEAEPLNRQAAGR
jgi:predicted Zn-dependent protease